MRTLVLILFTLYSIALFTSTAAMESLSWLLVLVALIDYIMKKVKGVPGAGLRLYNRAPWLELSILLYFISLVVSAVLNFDEIDEAFFSVGYIRWVPILYALTYLLRSYGDLQFRRIYKVMLVVVSLVAVYGIFQSFSGQDLVRETNKQVLEIGEHYRAIGFFNLPLTYAYSLGIFAFFVLAGTYLALFSKKTSQIVSQFGVFALIVAAIFGSFVRGAWLGLLAGAFGFSITQGKKIVLILMLSAAVFSGLAMAALPGLRARVMSIGDLQERSNAGRLKIWRANWQIFYENPVFGVGFYRNNELVGSYYEKLGIENGQKGHAHSNYLQALVGLGLPGFIAFCSLILLMLKITYALFKETDLSDQWTLALSIGGIASQFFFHLGGATECNFTDVEVNHILIFSWAFLLASVSFPFLDRPKVAS